MIIDWVGPELAVGACVAYADDVTVVIKNQKEVNIVNKHLQLYGEVFGVKAKIKQKVSALYGTIHGH